MPTETLNPRLDTPAVRHAARRIFNYLQQHPGATHQELLRRLVINEVTARRAENRLRKLELVTVELRGGTNRFTAEEGNYVELEAPDEKLMRALSMSLCLLNAAGLDDYGDCVAGAMEELEAKARRQGDTPPGHLPRLFAMPPVSSPCPNEAAVQKLVRVIGRQEEITVVTQEGRHINFAPRQLVVDPDAGWRVLGKGGASRTWAFDLADLEHVAGPRWRVTAA